MSTTKKISKPNQFNHENKTWIRLLEFLKQENAHLKTRLAEAVDYKTDKEFLLLAEQFQNKFLLKDEYIEVLKYDITKREQELQNIGNPSDTGLKHRQEKLRYEMENFEKDFNKLKYDFNIYLSSFL